MTRKRIEAWAILRNGSQSVCNTEAVARETAAGQYNHPATVHRLVEHEPAADAVVRAAIAWEKAQSDAYPNGAAFGEDLKLLKVVERLLKSRAKGRR